MGKSRGRGRGRGRGSVNEDPPGKVKAQSKSFEASTHSKEQDKKQEFPALQKQTQQNQCRKSKSEAEDHQHHQQDESKQLQQSKKDPPGKVKAQSKSFEVSTCPKEQDKKQEFPALQKQTQQNQCRKSKAEAEDHQHHQQDESKQLQQSKKVYELPKRPGIGKEGRHIKLNANFYALQVPKDAIIHHYDVTISDGKVADKLPKALGRRLIEYFVNKNLMVFKRKRPVFDGKKNMYTKEPLDFQGPRQFEVEFEEDQRKRKFTITLNWVSQVDLSVIQAVAQGKQKSVPQTVYQGLDLVLRHASSLSYVPVGSKFFQNNGTVNLGSGREMWPGYIVTVRPTDRWKLMLNIDISATAFYRHIGVLEFLQEILPKCDISNELSDRDRKAFEKIIKGLKIQITYMGNQKRKYRVNKLTKLGAAKQTFELDNKEKITVQNYFRKEKNVNLKFPNLNCLHVGNPLKNVYIPMEVCEVVPGQRCLKKLTEEQTSLMIRNTAKRPHERKKAIDTIVHDVAKYKNDQYVKSFGLQVNPRMTEVDARVLEPPSIDYQDRGRPLQPAGGAWNMRNKRLFQGANIKAWGLLLCNFFGRPTQQDVAEKFASELQRSANGMGIGMGKPIFIKNMRNECNPTPIIADAIKMNRDFDLLVVILPGKTNFYGRLKRMCETENGFENATNDNVKRFLKERGLSTQCIQSKNAVKCNPMTLAQLCLKINTKMGGVNNAINPVNKVTRPIKVFSEPVLFMGADVTHPGIGDKESPSIAAIVGSVDAIPSRYAVSVRVQKHRVEMIEDLKNVTIELLKQFFRELRVKPCKIIMYRDGVSEGQFQQVLQSELYAIQQACISLEKEYQPSITFIVVQKRHHGRFFVQNREDADRSGNCPPGTTIDTGVCHPIEYDYYQYSHSGIQGTSRPSHYHVLYDDNDFKPDELQALSFMLCHLYARCTRSVSIPAPAYYAHHVAFRAKDHLASIIPDDSSSERSGASSMTDQFERLNLKEIVRPHPKHHNRMYFV